MLRSPSADRPCRFGIPVHLKSAVLLLGALALLAGPAGAADFYGTGKLAISNAMGDTSGEITGLFPLTGDDNDTSPVFGGAVGFGFQYNEVLPSIGDWRVPDWSLRTEIEGLGGHDYEFTTNGAPNFFSEVTSWTLMQNFYFDFPIRPAVALLFGRVPILEPVSFFVGTGLGVAGNEVKTTDNFSTGSDTTFGLAWQVSTGFSYDFTDVVSFDLGYRYEDLGEVETDLRAGGGATVGNFSATLTSHQFTTGLRIKFYSLPLPSGR